MQIESQFSQQLPKATLKETQNAQLQKLIEISDWQEAQVIKDFTPWNSQESSILKKAKGSQQNKKSHTKEFFSNQNSKVKSFLNPRNTISSSITKISQDFFELIKLQKKRNFNNKSIDAKITKIEVSLDEDSIKRNQFAFPVDKEKNYRTIGSQRHSRLVNEPPRIKLLKKNSDRNRRNLIESYEIDNDSFRQTKYISVDFPPVYKEKQTMQQLMPKIEYKKMKNKLDQITPLNNIPKIQKNPSEQRQHNNFFECKGQVIHENRIPTVYRMKMSNKSEWGVQHRN